jgi:hypothetical protein
MPTEANDGPSYHRPRFRFDVGLTPTAPNASQDARVELIVELIVELPDDRRARLAQRLAEIGEVRN